MKLFWEESERGCAVSLPSHLVRLFTTFLVLGCFTRQGACRCVASQFDARPSHAREGASCPLGFSVRSPGSWLGGSWVSALLIGLFLHLHCDLAVMSGWFVLLFARSYLNSSAHKLPASTEHVLYGVACSLFVCFWLAVWFGFGSGFVGSLFRLHHGVDSGLRNGPRSLLTPQCGILCNA